jgi:UrcA family protein
MNMKLAYKWMPVLLTAAGAFGLTAAAQAGDADDDIPKQVVKFADLDLDSSAGAFTLYRRIESAAERVCGEQSGVRDLLTAIRLNSCREHAIERAVVIVNSAVLTSLYLAKSGRADKPKPITVAGVTP